MSQNNTTEVGNEKVKWEGGIIIHTLCNADL